MTAFENRSTIPVRADLRRAHDRAWRRLARPGTWWTGIERLAMVRESRLGQEGPDRPATTVLPSAAVELAHRVTFAPWSVDRRWAERTMDALGDAKYVEAVAVVSTAVNLDVFQRALGAAPTPPPEPEPGSPARRRPARLTSKQGWVAMARRGEMEPDPFAGAWTPNICRALSLVPDETKAMRDLIEAQYLPFEQVSNLRCGVRPGLTRPQMEWLAVRVSAANQCFY